MFELPNLIEGRYRAELYHPYVARQSVNFKHDGDSAITISSLESGHTLEVTTSKLHGNAGADVDVEVRLFRADGNEVFGESEPLLGLSVGDSLEFKGLAKGRYRLEIPKGSAIEITQFVEVKEGFNRVSLELTVAARIEIAITNPELSFFEIGDAKVSWKNLATGKVAKSINYIESLLNPEPPSKTLSAKGLSAGRWEVTIELEGYQTFTGVYETKPSQVTKAEAILVAK